MKSGSVFLAVLAAVLLVGTLAFGGIDDCYDATCRIRCSDGGIGTGCVFEISRGYVFVLTNRHIVGSAQAAQCSFWSQGHESVKIPGKVSLRSSQVDAAVVVVPVELFGGRLPKVIPIAPRNTQLEKGQTIVSVGCAKGAWATGFKGHVLGHSGKHLLFTPPPADGRSGSAIFNAEGTTIVGLLFGRAGDDSHGYAVTTDNLYRALNFKQTSSGEWIHSPQKVLNYGKTQCGPDGCLPNQSQLFPGGGYLSPWRYRQDQQNQQQNHALRGLDLKIDNLYPTLPPQGPNLDLQVGPRPQPRLRPMVPNYPVAEISKKKIDWPTGIVFPIVVAGSGLGAFIIGFILLAVLNVVRSVKGGRR